MYINRQQSRHKVIRLSFSVVTIRPEIWLCRVTQASLSELKPATRAMPFVYQSHGCTSWTATKGVNDIYPPHQE